MKTRASVSGFLKQAVSLLVSIVKAKSTALKSKTSAIKTRILVFGLLRNRRVLTSAIAHKIHALMPGHDDDDDEGARPTAAHRHDNSKGIVLYTAPAAASDGTRQSPDHPHRAGGIARCSIVEEEAEDDDDDGYPDLRHSLFDEEEDDYYRSSTAAGSVIDLVKSCRGEDQGEFVLEDEIDHVADIFIRRFHRQMRMQKLESFKRYQEMLERSV